MKIKVIDPQENLNLNFVIPNGFLMNRFLFHIIYKSIQKSTNQLPLEEEKIYLLIHALKQSKKQFGSYDLVDIESKDGEIVKIRI